MLRSFVGTVAVASLLIGSGAAPAHAWKTSTEWGYSAVKECPNRENLCVIVSCPAAGAPALELMMFEHGRGTGEEITLMIDETAYPLALPEEGENALYRWPLSTEIASGLQNGRAAGVIVDPGAEPHAVSLRGSGKAIRKVLSGCGGFDSGAVLPIASKGKGAARLTGLSDNEGCAEANSEGVVVARRMAGSKELEGFEFNDKRYGKSYINVSLPEAMSQSKKAQMHARLLELVKAGAKLRMKVQGCGAAARIEVVSEITPL